MTTKPRLIGFMQIVNGQIVPVAEVKRTRPALVAAAEAKLAETVEVAKPAPKLTAAEAAEQIITATTGANPTTGRFGSGKAVHTLVWVNADRGRQASGYHVGNAACGASGLTSIYSLGKDEATCKRCAKATAPETPKMGKRKLTATMPDGTIEDRTTAADYAFVVAVRVTSDGIAEGWGWGAWAWSSRRDLAEARVREFETRYADARRTRPGVTIETAIVPVN